MKLTPLDILQQSFEKKLRGYDPHKVDAFLELVRAEWEAILRENQELAMKVSRQDGIIREHQERERTLKETLIAAQRMADDMKQTAKKESEIIIGQAELQADKIIHQAHSRLTQIIDEINDLKKERAEFEGKLKGLIESHLRLLELQRDVHENDKLEDVAVLPIHSS